MKTDAYTKFLLSIIAVCLTFNVLKDMEIIQTAQATPPPLPYASNTVQDVNIVSLNGWNVSGGIPVKVTKWEAGNIDVNVNRWNAGRMDVNIERWNAGSLSVK